MDSNALDRHITGNWGEDSLGGDDFVKARDLAHSNVGTRIFVSADDVAVPIVATVEKVAITSGFVHVTAKEFTPVLVFGLDDTVELADD